MVRDEYMNATGKAWPGSNNVEKIFQRQVTKLGLSNCEFESMNSLLMSPDLNLHSLDGLGTYNYYSYEISFIRSSELDGLEVWFIHS